MATIRKSTKARKSASKKSSTRKTVRRSATKKRTTAGKRKANPALAKWRLAAKKAGYLRAGEGFKPLPKKNSSGYKRIMSIYKKMLKA